MGDPPVAGAFHDTVALPFPTVAFTPVGTPGTVHVVAVLLADCETPTAFVAVTAKVYSVPTDNPVIVVDVVFVVTVLLPGVTFTV